LAVRKTKKAIAEKERLRLIAKNKGHHQFRAGDAYICKNNIEHGDLRCVCDSKCVGCVSERGKIKYQRNIERYKDRCARYYRNNASSIKTKVRQYKKKNSGVIVEKNRDYYKSNADKIRNRSNKWKRNNPSRVSNHNIKRKLAKHERMQLPQSDIDLHIINEIYKKCSTLKDHHVDHRIPLLNESTPGNHSIYNLRIISKHDNLRKSNKLDSELNFSINEVDISDILELSDEYRESTPEERYKKSLHITDQEKNNGKT